MFNLKWTDCWGNTWTQSGFATETAAEGWADKALIGCRDIWIESDSADELSDAEVTAFNEDPEALDANPAVEFI